MGNQHCSIGVPDFIVKINETTWKKKEIGRKKVRLWFWLKNSHLDQSSKDCKDCNGLGMPQFEFFDVISI